MRKFAAVALALTLAGCADRPEYVVCTVDDTISFTADKVLVEQVKGNVLLIYRREGQIIYRNMLVGETCERAYSINWDLIED